MRRASAPARCERQRHADCPATGYVGADVAGGWRDARVEVLAARSVVAVVAAHDCALEQGQGNASSIKARRERARPKSAREHAAPIIRTVARGAFLPVSVAVNGVVVIADPALSNRMHAVRSGSGGVHPSPTDAGSASGEMWIGSRVSLQPYANPAAADFQTEARKFSLPLLSARDKKMAGALVW